MNDYPACVDCKHSYFDDFSWKCSEFPFEDVDYVTGNQSHHSADYCRKSSKKCGREARLFEPKEKLSFWQILKSFF